jgi:hypothetical protein
MPVPRSHRFNKTRKAFTKKTQEGGKIIMRMWTEKMHPNDYKPTIFYTMDNNRKIYEISQSPNVDKIRFTDVYKLTMDNNGKYTRGKRILHIKVMGVKYGHNKLVENLYGPTDKKLGNCFLFNKGNGTYIYVGHKIYSFKSKGDIGIWSSFYCPIAKTGRIYPYCIGEKYTYFFRENMVVSNIVLGVKAGGDIPDIRKDAYNMFYGDAAGWAQKKLIDFSKKAFEIKIIDNGLESD